MLRRPYLVIISACLFFLASEAGQAATWKGEELLRQWQQAAWRLGPFKIQPMILLTNAGYDDNVYYYSRGHPVKDYTLTAGPAINAYLRIKKILFTFYGSPQYVYFHQTKRERTWNYYSRAEVNFIFNRFLITAGANYSDARERWNTEIDIRPRRRERSNQASFFWQLRRRLSLALTARQSQYEYENLEYEIFRIAEALNRTENYATLSTYFQLTGRTRFFLEAEYGLFEFENPASRRDSESQALYAGLEFSPAGRIRGRIHLGYKYFDSKAAERSDYHGLVGDTKLQIRLMRRLWVRGEVRRDVRFSLWYDNTFYLENIWSVGTSVYLHRRIRLDYDLIDGRNRYPEPAAWKFSAEQKIESLIKRLDHYRIHSAALYYRLGKDIGLGLVFSRWQRDSNFDWEDDRRHFIGLNLTYSF